MVCKLFYSLSAQTLRCKQYPEWLLVLNSLSTARLHAGCEFRPTALMQPVRKSAARRRVDRPVRRVLVPAVVHRVLVVRRVPVPVPVPVRVVHVEE